jgi:molybdate transport system substrate-binding protein
VAAASDLQLALPVLIDHFRTSTGIEVEAIFGSSGLLAKQISQGAPYDVFLAANRSFVSDLADEGFIAIDSVRPYARGVLVLAISLRADAPIFGLADLAREEVKKVSIANPEFAPYGVAASQVIERAGLGESLALRLVRADSVRHAFQFVETGNAEAGFVSHALTRDSKLVRILEIDAHLYDPILQFQGVLSRSQRSDEARQFADFLLSEAAQSVLRTYGFMPPDPTTRPLS